MASPQYGSYQTKGQKQGSRKAADIREQRRVAKENREFNRQFENDPAGAMRSLMERVATEKAANDKVQDPPKSPVAPVTSTIANQASPLYGSSSPSGSKKAPGATTATYYVVVNGVIYEQNFNVTGSLTEVV